MKEEILDIAKKLYHNHLTIETGTNLLLGLFNVVEQSGQAGVCMHNLDMTGKCFKCGEQYIRKEGN